MFIFSCIYLSIRTLGPLKKKDYASFSLGSSAELQSHTSHISNRWDEQTLCILDAIWHAVAPVQPGSMSCAESCDFCSCAGLRWAPEQAIRWTTWPYLLFLQHPSPQLCAKLVNPTQTSHRHSPPVHISRRCGGPNAGGRGGGRWYVEKWTALLSLPPFFSCLPAVRSAGTPAPMRFAVPNDSPSSRAGTAGNVCSGWCSSPRFVFHPVTFCFVIFTLRSRRRQTLKISREISSCQNCCRNCHIPTVPWRSMLRSGLPASSAPPGSRRTGGRRDWIRALQQCMRGTDGQIPGFTCQHKTKCILFKIQSKMRAVQRL